MHAVLESVASGILREMSGLSADIVQAHPEDNMRRWSRRQIVEHLSLSYRATSQILGERLAKGRISRQQQRTGLQWFLQLMVLSIGYMPSGLPALEETVPASDSRRKDDGDFLSESLTAELETMDALLQSCRKQFGMERVAPHPILGPLRVDQWRRYHAVHGMHHLRQLVRMRQERQTVLAPEGHPRHVRLVEELQVPAQRSIP